MLRERNTIEELRKTSELDALRKQVVELQSKLIRGAPHPDGFSIEVAERQGLVLARPEHWEPKGGTIFDLELGDFDPKNPQKKTMKQDDQFTAAFRCYFIPIPKDENEKPIGRERYYENELKDVRDASTGLWRTVDSFSSEFIRLGGDPSAVASLKIIARQFVKITIGPSADTGRMSRNWRTIARNDFTGRILEVTPSTVPVGRPLKVQVRASGLRDGAILYVDGEKRETKVDEVGGFVWLTLKDEDVNFPWTLRIEMENPDADGLLSEPWQLPVMEKAATEEQPFSSATASQGGSAALLGQTVQGDTGEPPDARSTEASPAEPKRDKVCFRQVSRLRVVCFHQQMGNVYFFDFWDDVGDFVTSSAEFNQVLASARFLS